MLHNLYCLPWRKYEIIFKKERSLKRNTKKKDEPAPAVVEPVGIPEAEQHGLEPELLEPQVVEVQHEWQSAVAEVQELVSYKIEARNPITNLTVLLTYQAVGECQ